MYLDSAVLNYPQCSRTTIITGDWLSAFTLGSGKHYLSNISSTFTGRVRCGQDVVWKRLWEELLWYPQLSYLTIKIRVVLGIAFARFDNISQCCDCLGLCHYSSTRLHCALGCDLASGRVNWRFWHIMEWNTSLGYEKSSARGESEGARATE